LVQIADHEQLHTAESARGVTVAAKHVVDSVEQVCPHHADLVDHQQVKRPEQLDFVAGKAPLTVDFPRRVGKVQPHRQLKKRMQRHASSVNRSDTGRCGNDHPLRAFFFDLVQERGLACARFPCEKNILARIADVFECKIELGIGNETHVLKC